MVVVDSGAALVSEVEIQSEMGTHTWVCEGVR